MIIYYTYHNIQHKNTNILKKRLTGFIFFSTYRSVNIIADKISLGEFVRADFLLLDG